LDWIRKERGELETGERECRA